MKKIKLFASILFILIGNIFTSQAQIISIEPCDEPIIANIRDLSINDCRLYGEIKVFDGSLASYNFKWTIKNLSTNEMSMYGPLAGDPSTQIHTFNGHVFDEDATYEVKIVVRRNNTSCVEILTENLNVSGCGDVIIDPPPSCPNSDIVINNIEGCRDFQATYHANSLIDHIKWYYRICGVNGGQDVYIGQTSGNANYQHAKPFNLPHPGDYDDCILIVKAKLYKANGTQCPQEIQTERLSCDTGGGIGIFRGVIVPNPSTGVFKISDKGTNKVARIMVHNSYGSLVKTIKTSSNDVSVDLSYENEGIYFVEIKYENNTSLIKRVIINK